jgi:hypothetical protein
MIPIWPGIIEASTPMREIADHPEAFRHDPRSRLYIETFALVEAVTALVVQIWENEYIGSASPHQRHKSGHSKFVSHDQEALVVSSQSADPRMDETLVRSEGSAGLHSGAAIRQPFWTER